jgi:hypothetical protein
MQNQERDGRELHGLAVCHGVWFRDFTRIGSNVVPRMVTGARSLAKVLIVKPRGRFLDRLLLLEETGSKQRPANRDRGGNTQAQQRRRAFAAEGALSEHWRRRDYETSRSKKYTHIRLSIATLVPFSGLYAIKPEK